MMKNINQLMVLVLGLAIMVTSCSDRLNLEPEQALSTEAAFSDEATSTASLMGVYSRAQDLNVYGSMPQIVADYQSDNVNFIGSFPTLQDINNYITLSDNASIRDIWRDHYRVVLAANAVIQNVPGVEDPGFTAEEKAQYVAEATFMRALSMFSLVTNFAQPFSLDNGASDGIPIVLTPGVLNGDVAMPARSSVADVYVQIERDLNESRAALPDAAAGPGRATQAAVDGLLSRLFLYKGDWDAAASSAASVIGNGINALAPNYGFYNSASPEDVFTILNSATDNGRTGSGGWASYYQPAELGGRGDCPFSQDLLDAYASEAGDLRFASLSLVNVDGNIYTTKFPDAVNNADNSPVIRVSEMYLNRAEALTRSTNTVNEDAITLMNDLRLRAGLPAMIADNFMNAEELIDQILIERRKELCFEGHRRMDLLRIGKNLRAAGAGAGASGPGADKVIMPIPQREIDLNSSLEQNPGY